MRNRIGRRFHKGLRFRIGAIFGGLLLVCLLGVGGFLYHLVTTQLERSFRDKLAASASAVLSKTETAPLIIPLPDSGEYFTLIYQSYARTDTLFDNLAAFVRSMPYSYDYRIVRETAVLESGATLQVVYAQRADRLNADVISLRRVLFLYLPLALLLAFIAAYFLSGFLLRPVASIIRQAQKISLQDKVQLLDVPATGDELHEMAQTLNGMLMRIQSQADQQNAFFAAAAHELRTPLANMLTGLQVAESRAAVNGMLPFVRGQIVEVQRLKKLVNDFLLLSQLKAGALTPMEAPVALMDVCLDAIERVSARAAARGNRIRVEALPEDGDFTITADVGHLAMVIGNLLENAVKFSPLSSLIMVGIQEQPGGITLSINNETSQRVDVEGLSKAFARTEASVEGFGLGLWLSSWLCELNGCRLELFSEQSQFAALIKFSTRFD